MIARGDHVVRGINDGLGRKRQIYLRPQRRVRSYKPLRHHAHDRERSIGNPQLVSDDARVSTEAVLPVTLAQHYGKSRWAAAWAIVHRGKVTTQ